MLNDQYLIRRYDNFRVVYFLTNLLKMFYVIVILFNKMISLYIINFFNEKTNKTEIL